MVKQTGLALMALMLTAACDSKMASTGTQQLASVEWEVVTASDSIAHTPRNQNLIFMR